MVWFTTFLPRMTFACQISVGVIDPGVETATVGGVATRAGSVAVFLMTVWCH